MATANGAQEVEVTPGAQVDSIRVLLVEDDPGDALLTQELLAGPGLLFMVDTVKRLSDAMGVLRAGVDCVLLDLGLPDAGGLEALDQIVGAAPNAAVIVLTGRADRDLALTAMTRGAQDYLQKGGLDGDLLSRAVRYAVERKRSEEAARQLFANMLLAAESARLERGLLARPMLDQAGLRSAARYRSGGGSLLLGGDFYDAIEMADGSVRVVIGDVSGHGPDEAATGVALRIAWRGFVLAGVGPDRILEHMQALLNAERLQESVFATVCDATIAADRCSVTLRTAGHPPPLLIGRVCPPGGQAPPGGQMPPGGKNHQVEVLSVEPGPPLGMFEPATWPAQQFSLPSEWALVFYTDGIIEGRIKEVPGGRLGLEGLISGIRLTASPAPDLGQLADELVAIAEGHNGGPVADDIALLLVAYPPDAAAPGPAVPGPAAPASPAPGLAAAGPERS